jgi:putative copper export protein
MSSDALRALADAREREERERDEREHGREVREEKLLSSFSKWVMAAVMMMFFAGVALGAYAIIIRGEPPDVTQDYIMRLAQIVGCGYFVKAFGENIARIVLSARLPGRADAQSEPEPEDEGGI